MGIILKHFDACMKYEFVVVLKILYDLVIICASVHNCFVCLVVVVFSGIKCMG